MEYTNIMNLFLKKNCNHCVRLLETMQEYNIPTDDVNIYIHGNDDFPPFVTRTPTIMYKNFPYVGRKAFDLIASLKQEPEEEFIQQEPQQVRNNVRQERDLNTSSSNMISQSLDGFGALYDSGNHVLLTETGFDEQLTDLSNLKEDEPQELDLQKLIDSRNADIARLAPPKP